MTRNIILHIDNNQDDHELLKLSLEETQDIELFYSSSQIDSMNTLQNLINHENSFKILIMLEIELENDLANNILHLIKSSPDFKHIPIIIYSRSNNKKIIDNALDKFANSVIPKANSIDETKLLMQKITRFWFSRYTLLKATKI